MRTPEPRSNNAARRAVPDTMHPVIALTFGVDGRLYCHDLPPELADLLGTFCGDVPAVHGRVPTKAVAHE